MVFAPVIIAALIGGGSAIAASVYSAEAQKSEGKKLRRDQAAQRNTIAQEKLNRRKKTRERARAGLLGQRKSSLSISTSSTGVNLKDRRTRTRTLLGN